MVALSVIRFRISLGSNTFGDSAPGVTMPSLPVVGDTPPPTTIIAAVDDVAAARIWLFVVAAVSTAYRTTGSSPCMVATAFRKASAASVDVPPAAEAAFV